MKTYIKRANSKLSIGKAAALLSAMSLASMFLSLFRERLLIANFGVLSLDLDAYRAAFKLPDFMFIVLVSGALSVTFIPILSERLTKGNKKSAWELSSSLVNFLAILTAIASVVIVLFADPIVTYLVAPGMSPDGQKLAVDMMRIIAINPFLFSISAVLTSIQQAIGRFFFFALAPLIYSLGIIFGIIYLAPNLGIIGVAYGVVIGSVLQLIIALIGMVGVGFNYKPEINWRNIGFRDVLKLLPQRSVDQGIDYFNNLIEISIASRLGRGLINAWEVAFTLHWVPINLIGVAISTAAFPQMTERINQKRPDLFKKEFITILRVVVWLALPTVIIAYIGRGYLVRLLIADGSPIIANLLGLLVVAMFFRAIFHLVSRSYYAQKDTRTPLLVSVFSIGLNVLLAAYLALQTSLGLNGLAIAQSSTAVLEVLILLIIMERRQPGMFDVTFLWAILRMVLAAVIGGVFTYALVRFFPLRAEDVGFFTLVPKFGLIVFGSLVSYILASFALKLGEPKPIIDRALKIIYRPVKIQ